MDEMSFQMSVVAERTTLQQIFDIDISYLFNLSIGRGLFFLFKEKIENIRLKIEF